MIVNELLQWVMILGLVVASWERVLKPALLGLARITRSLPPHPSPALDGEVSGAETLSSEIAEELEERSHPQKPGVVGGGRKFIKAKVNMNHFEMPEFEESGYRWGAEE